LEESNMMAAIDSILKDYDKDMDGQLSYEESKLFFDKAIYSS